MKKYLTLILVLTVTALTGCAGWEPIQKTEQVTAYKVTQPEIRHQLPSGETLVIPAYEKTEYKTNSVAIVNPRWETAIQTTQAAAKFVPAPFGGVIDLIAGGVASVLALVVARQRKQISAGEVIVQGIEKLNDQKVKQFIKDFSENKNKKELVHEFVQKATHKTI